MEEATLIITNASSPHAAVRQSVSWREDLLDQPDERVLIFDMLHWIKYYFYIAFTVWLDTKHMVALQWHE